MFLRALNNLLLLLGLTLLPLAWAQNPEAPASANQLLERLQGRWQQKYWREHQMQENYQDVTINWRGAVQEMTLPESALLCSNTNKMVEFLLPGADA